MTTQEKWNVISKTIYLEKIAILAVQETYLDQQMTEQLKLRYKKNLRIVVSPHLENPRVKAGVTFIINKKLIRPEEIKPHELIPGRALMINIKWLGSCITSILNIYAPNERTAHPQFWVKTQTKRRSCHLPKPEFALGDFNVTEDTIDRKPPRLDDASASNALREIRHDWEIHNT